MTLPKVATTTHTCTLPSSKKKIKFRPFLVKEQKILLMAAESKNEHEIINALKTIVESCVIDDIDASSLTMVDLQFIYLQLRLKSADEVVKVWLTPDNTQPQVPVEVNLSKYTIIENKKRTNMIVLDEKITIEMRDPTISDMEDLLSITDPTELSLQYIRKCVTTLFTADGQSYKFSDETLEEQNEWVESLSETHIQKIKEYFEGAPKLRWEIKYFDANQKEQTVVVEQLQDFFT